MLFARRLLAGPGRWWSREAQQPLELQLPSEEAWEDADKSWLDGQAQTKAEASNPDEWDWDLVEAEPAKEDQPVTDDEDEQPPAVPSSHSGLSLELPTPTSRVAGSVSHAQCPVEAMTAGDAVRAAPSQTVVYEDADVGLNPLQTSPSDATKPGWLENEDSPGDPVHGPQENETFPADILNSLVEAQADREEQPRATCSALHCSGRTASTWCGLFPGSVPRGSEDELASKLQKQLARAEQEGCVLQSCARRPSNVDVQATTAAEAKAERQPKSSGTCVQLLYASKRHSLFDFQELEAEEKMMAD